MATKKDTQEKIQKELDRLAGMIENGFLLASMDPAGFIEAVADELKRLQRENIALRADVDYWRRKSDLSE